MDKQYELRISKYLSLKSNTASSGEKVELNSMMKALLNQRFV